LTVVILLAVLLPILPVRADQAEFSFGVDSLREASTALEGRRVGLVTHLAAVDRDGSPTVNVLTSLQGVQLTALFAPEHGIDGSVDAGVPVRTIPGRTPVYSLYGGSFRPSRQMMSRVDVLVVDLQDVGVRPYTYASTMALVLTAARDANKPVVVLDRPNPMGGMIVDGPVLEPQFRSFIGLYPIPYVHGMTFGELARLYNQAFRIGADLTVIPMQGWNRGMIWNDTGRSWVNPSPGITNSDAVFTYAATGPLDGTNVWNGVATESRYQVFLAPWIDGPKLAERLNAKNIPGVMFSASAVPHPRKGTIWRGVRVHVTDPRVFRPSTTTVYVLAEIRSLYGNQLKFKRPRRGNYLFDTVWGTKSVRLGLMRGESASAIVAKWQPGLQKFEQLRENYLLYK
jgi:uncharacterized protein YbbC (DUF1343 family)